MCLKLSYVNKAITSLIIDGVGDVYLIIYSCSVLLIPFKIDPFMDCEHKNTNVQLLN